MNWIPFLEVFKWYERQNITKAKAVKKANWRILGLFWNVLRTQNGLKRVASNEDRL